MNPWNLSPAEVTTIRAFIAGGRAKTVARDLGISPKTVEKHTEATRRKMKTQTLLSAALKFDRWERENSASPCQHCAGNYQNDSKTSNPTGVTA